MKKIIAGIIFFATVGCFIYLFPGFCLWLLSAILILLAVGLVSNVFYWAVETLFG